MLTSNKKSFELVLPAVEDAETIYRWRLDPEVMKNSFTFSKPVSFEEFFSSFLETYFSVAKLPPLFMVVEGKRVGVLRFNQAHQGIEISIVLSSDARGKGYGTEFLKMASRFAAIQGYEKIIAKIKEFNSPSQRAFEKASYQFKGTEGNVKIYEIALNKSAPKKVFLIAEAGSNWKAGSKEEDLKQAIRLIKAAKQGGADAVKFQVFRAESTYAAGAGVSDYLENYGEISDVFKELEMPYDMLPKLFKVAEEEGIEFMATPFSLEDFKAIDPYVKRHKIASYENAHIHLLEAAAKSGKPILLSTGASTLEEVAWSCNYLKTHGASDLILMQCTAKYPAPPEEMNLRVLTTFKEKFRVPVGLSDHSLDPYAAPLAACALGATVIEKHFTLDRQMKGPDHIFAILPEELKVLSNGIKLALQMKGEPFKKIEPSEKELHLFAKRGIQALKAIHKGELLREGVTHAILRPGKNSKGRHPKHIHELEGKPADKNYRAGEGI